MNKYGLLLEKQFIMTLLCGVTRFPVVKLLQKGGNFNTSYHVNEIASEIASWREGQSTF
jgi:hypothetical protein